APSTGAESGVAEGPPRYIYIRFGPIRLAGPLYSYVAGVPTCLGRIPARDDDVHGQGTGDPTPGRMALRCLGKPLPSEPTAHPVGLRRGAFSIWLNRPFLL